MRDNIVQIRPIGQELACTNCGSIAQGTCDCGVAYLPAGARAARAVAEHPEKSDRAIAADIGVDHKTVSKARRESGGERSPRVGRDGKTYAVPDEDEAEDDDQTIFRRGLLARANAATAAATYENWSHYEIDAGLVNAVKQASEAWRKLAAYLEKLNGKT